MKTRAKGTRNRTKCKNLFISNGFICDVVEKSGKYNSETDCYGLFDLVAEEPQTTCWIQVVSNRPHKHSKYQEHANIYQN